MPISAAAGALGFLFSLGLPWNDVRSAVAPSLPVLKLTHVNRARHQGWRRLADHLPSLSFRPAQPSFTSDNPCTCRKIETGTFALHSVELTMSVRELGQEQSSHLSLMHCNGTSPRGRRQAIRQSRKSTTRASPPCPTVTWAARSPLTAHSLQLAAMDFLKRR